MGIVFGSAGNPLSFYEKGFKSSFQMPAYLKELGLGAYEYQCGKGVSIGEKTARMISEEAKIHGITLSLHTPYYISLTATDEQKVQNNIRYITKSAEALNWLGGTRLVVHAGAAGKGSRGEALSVAKRNLFEARAALDQNSYGQMIICPETMGKINQLGTLEEMIELCLLDDRMIPCVDFGHLNARGHGVFKNCDDYLAVLNTLEDKLGRYRMQQMHIHFSKIAYSAGGEVRHLTFEDREFGPPFKPLIEALFRKNASPVVICESAGTQAEDALQMQNAWKEIQKQYFKADERK